eukprot:TRINITY_DN4566_c0_g1_i1.p1 TRINITY_DN4566_c0_g1~~TRINITY_DN4566_c0_g1_i1.p1  ORF type:complete len:174 (+),score=18.97 TRINITY_DN4566_c0_g1_i1:25-522(+)
MYIQRHHQSFIITGKRCRTGAQRAGAAAAAAAAACTRPSANGTHCPTAACRGNHTALEVRAPTVRVLHAANAPRLRARAIIMVPVQKRGATPRPARRTLQVVCVRKRATLMASHSAAPLPQKFYIAISRTRRGCRRQRRLARLKPAWAAARPPAAPSLPPPCTLR